MKEGMKEKAGAFSCLESSLPLTAAQVMGTELLMNLVSRMIKINPEAGESTPHLWWSDEAETAHLLRLWRLRGGDLRKGGDRRPAARRARAGASGSPASRAIRARHPGSAPSPRGLTAAPERGWRGASSAGAATPHSSGSCDPRPRPGHGEGQPAGRGDRAGPSARCHRCDPRGHRRARPAPACGEIRHGDDVRGHRHGCSRHPRAGLSRLLMRCALAAASPAASTLNRS